MFDKRFAATVAVAAVMAALVAGLGPVGTKSARAATGDPVHVTTFASPCPSGTGLGVAYDGTYLWYSCAYVGTDLFRADPVTGADEGSWTIDGGLGAIAYDAVHNAIWAGWDSAHTLGDVTYIPLDSTQSVITSGVTVKFNVTPHVVSALDDGIAYDAANDSVYVSPDTSTTIYRYSTSGTLLDSVPWAGNECYNSGLAVGAEQLYEGADGCTEVFVANRAGNSLSGKFPTNVGRTEGLACDPKTFYPKDVLWAVGNQGQEAAAYEIPAASCGIGGRDVSPIADAYTVYAATSDASGNPIAAVNAVADARTNAGQVTDNVADVPLPGGLGEVTVGANSASVSEPFDGTASATARISSVTIDLPAVPPANPGPCRIQADGIVVGAAMTASGAGGPYTTAVGPETSIASLDVCGRTTRVSVAPAVISLPNGLGTLATFASIADGDGTTLAEREVDALRLHLTIGGTTTDIVVGSAYVGYANNANLTPRPPTSPAVVPNPSVTVPAILPAPGPGGKITGGCVLAASDSSQGELTGTMTEASTTTDDNGVPIAATVGCSVVVDGVSSTPEYQYPGPNGVQAGKDDVDFFGSPSDVIDLCKRVSYASGLQNFSCVPAQWLSGSAVIAHN